MIRLPQLTTGATARLVQVGGDLGFRRRLMELGLLPGTEIRLVRRADIGNLLELEVRGCHLSVRRSDAEHLMVELAG